MIISAVAVYYGKTGTWFDSNFLNEEAKGLESIELQDDIVEKFQLSYDNAIFTVPDIDSAHRITSFLQDQKSVGMVESPSLLCPPAEIQARRRVYLEKILAQTQEPKPVLEVDISAFKAEVERLEANVIEMGQGAYMSLLDRVVKRTDRLTGLDSAGKKVAPGIFSPFIEYLDALDQATAKPRLQNYQQIFKPYSRDMIRRMAGTQEVTWDMVPPESSENLKSRDGSEYLVTVYPKDNTWEDLMNSPFIKLLHKTVPGATGMTPLMELLYDRGRSEGKMAVIYALIAIFILLLVDFRSIKYTLLAMMPLGFAAIWLVGGYGLFGAPFTLMNVMAIPLILGIGIDDGVHVVHRYRRDSNLSMGEVLGYVGRAIFLTTATTMLAFGSFNFSHMQGNVRIGRILFFGVGLCFVMTVVLLPALLRIFQRKEVS
jgi:hypothetical protein